MSFYLISPSKLPLIRMIGGPKEKNFTDEINPGLKHDKFGTVSTANVGPNLNDSNVLLYSLPYLIAL